MKRRKYTRDFKIGVIREIESGKPPAQVSRENRVRNAIQNVAVEFPAYGYRRITAELRRRGYTVTVNHKRVLRLLREENLLCVRTPLCQKDI